MDMGLTGTYGSFLEVAFALNLISTWTGLYRSLAAMAQDVEVNASSDALSQRLTTNLKVVLQTLKAASRFSGFVLSCAIFVFLLYGLPRFSCACEPLLITILLWVCGGTVPILSGLLYAIVRFYYPLRIRNARIAEARRQEAIKAAKEAEAKAQDELLDRLEREGKIIRIGRERRS